MTGKKSDYAYTFVNEKIFISILFFIIIYFKKIKVSILYQPFSGNLISDIYFIVKKYS